MPLESIEIIVIEASDVTIVSKEVNKANTLETLNGVEVAVNDYNVVCDYIVH